MSCTKFAIDTSFERLDEHRERMCALALGALTLMREQRERDNPTDAELIVGVLLDLLEQREHLRYMQEALYRVAGVPATSAH